MIGPAEIATLYRHGLIPPDRYLEAVFQVRDRAFWTRWAQRTLLAVGVAHLLAAIVFFFAYNWAEIPAIAKLAVPQAGILACLAGAWFMGLDRPAGQAVLIGATVLTGVLLAVIGQTYQTGADAFELFLPWALFTLPWVLASRSAAHWLVWLAIAGLAAHLSARQALAPMGWIYGSEALVAPGILLASALAAREIAVKAGNRWLSARWTRQIVLFPALAMLCYVAARHVFFWHSSVVSLVAFVAVAGSGAWFYGKHRPDLAAITQVIGFVALFLMAAGGRWIFRWTSFDNVGLMMLGLGAIVVFLAAVTGGMALVLRTVRRRLSEATS